MKAGDIVRFRDPNTDEIGTLYVVIEMRNPRVLVQALGSGLTYPPQAVYLVADMEVAGDTEVRT